MTPMRLPISRAYVRTRFDHVTAARGKAAADAEDAKALQALTRLDGAFLPWTSYSMRPAAILAAASDVVIMDRRQIVECGSGNSTIYLARLLSQRGKGRITTIEHDAGWAATTSQMLEREGLLDVVTVVHAPLVAGWYDTHVVDAAGLGTAADLLVVDGPPAHGGTPDPSIRRKALDVFHTRLTPDATIILDDAGRRGEREVLAKWTESFERRFSVESGGYAISAPYSA